MQHAALIGMFTTRSGKFPSRRGKGGLPCDHNTFHVLEKGKEVLMEN